MISNDSNTSRGCAGWLTWLIGTGIALVAAGGSIVTILQYVRLSEPPVASAPNTVIVVPATSVPSPTPQVVSPEMWQAVEDFLSLAVVSEITAYQYGDSSYATMFYADALESLENRIAELNSRGLFLSAYFDSDKSYIADIRLAYGNRLEVDSCEFWAGDYYDRQTGTLIGSDAWALTPQTITIERLNTNFYITSVAFYTGRAFCR